MGKLVIWLLGTLFFIGLALIPEGAMVFTYHLIAPQTEITKIITLAVFWLGGVGISVTMAFVSLALWLSFTQVVLN